MYAARDYKGCLTHYQTVQQAGTSSLLTVDEVNGEQVVTVQPHAVDQVPFFLGNLLHRNNLLTGKRNVAINCIKRNIKKQT